jgi:hypothetical protein
MNIKNILLATAFGACVAAMPIAGADEDHGGKPGLAPVKNELYRAECGACHFAFPPGLLPARSWEKLMENLHDHFGENAELTPEDFDRVLNYLRAEAADRSDYARSQRAASMIAAGDTPLRITETRYFRRLHDEVPRRVFNDNPNLKTISQCKACHTRADQNSYRENEIEIPGHGRWED